MGFFFICFFWNLQRICLGSSLAAIAKLVGVDPCSGSMFARTCRRKLGISCIYVYTPCSQHECCSSIVFCIPL